MLCILMQRYNLAANLLLTTLLYLSFNFFICVIPAFSQAPHYELQKIFASTPEEDVAPTKWEMGNTIVSNEDRLELFKKYVEDIGGGYIGVGGTQNFLLASWANSEWIWLVDFTKRVVAANRIHIAFLKEAETPEQFRSLWTKSFEKKAMEIISKEFGKDPEIDYIKKTWKIGLGYIPWRFRNLDKITKKYKYSIWLNDQKYYDRIRMRAIEGKIIARKGDLNGAITLKGIGTVAKIMNVPIRVIYLSNAEEYIATYSENFIKNLTSLPFDDRSIVLRTISFQRFKYPWAPDSEISTDKGFHYNVMPFALFQQYLTNAGKRLSIHELMKYAIVDKVNGISVINSLFSQLEQKKIGNIKK